MKISPEDENVRRNCYLAFIKKEIVQPDIQQLRLLNFVKPLIEEFKNSKWLTVGDSSYGCEARFLEKNDIDVLATDININNLMIANNIGYIRKYKKENIEKLSFPDKSFDIIMAKETIHHLKKPYSGIYEMIRVARKAIVLIEPRDFIGMDLNSFEPNGNFIFGISEREIIKISMAMGVTEVAYKLFNLCYFKNKSNNLNEYVIQRNKKNCP